MQPPEPFVDTKMKQIGNQKGAALLFVLIALTIIGLTVWEALVAH